jgi:hypothetical protein
MEGTLEVSSVTTHYEHPVHEEATVAADVSVTTTEIQSVIDVADTRVLVSITDTQTVVTVTDTRSMLDATDTQTAVPEALAKFQGGFPGGKSGRK